MGIRLSLIHISINRIANYMSVIMFNKPAIDAVYHDLKQIDELNLKKYDIITTQNKLSIKDKISVKNLYFKYPDADTYVLDNVSFDILKNQSTALIGPSGAGKTTLADIILGALQPTAGGVFVDDKNIMEYMQGWHENLGYIPQTIYLMDDSCLLYTSYNRAETCDCRGKQPQS